MRGEVDVRQSLLPISAKVVFALRAALAEHGERACLHVVVDRHDRAGPAAEINRSGDSAINPIPRVRLM